MKKPAILATLMLLAPPVMAADDPCNHSTGDISLSCIPHLNQNIRELEEKDRTQNVEIQALKMHLSLFETKLNRQQAENQALKIQVEQLSNKLLMIEWMVRR